MPSDLFLVTEPLEIYEYCSRLLNVFQEDYREKRESFAVQTIDSEEKAD